MPLQRAEEIFRYLTRQSDFDIDTDISSLLEEYLNEAGIRQVDENDLRALNFPEIAIVLHKSGEIYSKKVDSLWLLVQNALSDIEREETSEDPTQPNKRIRKKIGFTDFKRINLEEATNITMRNDTSLKPAPVLPRAFIQFEPRVISVNDIQLKDYNDETIGLMSDFRVNWNTGENFTLCDDMDFSSSKSTTVVANNNNALENEILSPSDSGHMSDSFTELLDNVLNSPGMNSDSSHCRVTPILAAETANTISKMSKRKLVTEEKTKNKKTKYDITSPLVGTVKHLNFDISEFSPCIFKKIIKERKIAGEKFLRFIKEICIQTENMTNKMFYMNEFSPCLKKRPCVTWSRKEVQKKLKLSRSVFSDSQKEEIGFSDDEELEEKICELRKASEKISLNGIKHSKTDDDNDEDDFRDADNDVEPENHFEPTETIENVSQSSCADSLAQSEIAKKIEAWHASIQEKLKITEKRKNFDLKSYSEDILNVVKCDDSSPQNFSKVIEKKPAEDIARYFLTTLMLANKGKIIIKEPKPLTCGDFQIILSQDGANSECDDSTYVL